MIRDEHPVRGPPPFGVPRLRGSKQSCLPRLQRLEPLRGLDPPEGETPNGFSAEHAIALGRPAGQTPSRLLYGWHRQAESSELGDGGLPVRRTIAKAYRP